MDFSQMFNLNEDDIKEMLNNRQSDQKEESSSNHSAFNSNQEQNENNNEDVIKRFEEIHGSIDDFITNKITESKDFGNKALDSIHDKIEQIVQTTGEKQDPTAAILGLLGAAKEMFQATTTQNEMNYLEEALRSAQIASQLAPQLEGDSPKEEASMIVALTAILSLKITKFTIEAELHRIDQEEM